ncbi:GNAT family N-acetyltransferase [Blastococcus mobilis]|uniref:FR47-like protein n=1 Tax=Blastococcus mobilis TaxID=1938746 RepID=A0A238W271_9ACTN|nr:GNAT family N-acetyltransferase [Blastococcus mobilis]SNR40616.1 FR47-like protein [Blastococcus mobilis]
MTDIDAVVLDDPVGQSLRGHHAHLARRLGRVTTYLPEVATFAAVPSEPTNADWEDLARLLGPRELADLFSATATPPETWAPVFSMNGVQMVAGPEPIVGSAPAGAAIVELGDADVPDMLALANLTRPGPFWRGTVVLGAYVGIRQNGALVAMAGERLRPPGWTEISAVCTAPHARGRGFASALVRSVIRRIVDRSERPFLHVAADNAAAISMYERLGFETRRRVRFHGYRTP